MNFRKTAKQIVKTTLGICFTKSKDIPVIVGPLKGRHLPRYVALQNFSMIFGQYESHVVSGLLTVPGAIDVAYDVGAHVGYMTLVLAKRVRSGGKVFAFEPEPNNIKVMHQLISQNGLQHIIRVIPIALAGANGEQNLIKWKSSSMYLLEGAIDGQDLRECLSISVHVITLDTFVFELSNPPPDLLKIDVEGSEAFVLQGGLRTLSVYSPIILIEIHGPKNAKGVWELIRDFDYSWNHLTMSGREMVSSEKQLLSFFCKDSWTHHFMLSREQGITISMS